MNSEDLITDKVSTWYLIPGLTALVMMLLFIVQSLSPSASAQKELSMAAVVTKPVKTVTGSLRNLQATTANLLVNNPATDQNPGKTQSNATIVWGSGMTLISAYNDSGSRLFGNRLTGYSRSTDVGATWRDLESFPFDNAGVPVLASHNATGRIYLSALPFSGLGVLVSSSTDQGVTWGAAVQVSPVPSGTTDRPWIAVDNFVGSGNGNLYLSFSNLASGDGIRFARSTDSGNTFSAPILIASQGSFSVNGAFVTVGPNHSVYVFWLDQSAGAGSPNIIKEQKSTDQGITFATTSVATLNTTGTSGSLGDVGGFRTNSFPQAAVNPVSGDIYLVYNDVNTPAMDRGDIYLQQSTDGGATWGARLKVNTDATNNLNWQPTLAVTADGTKIMVAWYDRRNDPNDSLIEYFGRAGSISGSTITFGPDFAISDSSFPAVFGQDSFVDPTYMGDYDQMSADNNSFYTVWGDNRLSSAPDVRFAKICTELSQCPANIVVSNNQGQCGAVVSYSSPGCATIVLACSPASGTLFPLGTTTVTCTTTAGPSCSFTVSVNDTQAPSITCPANATVVGPPSSSGVVVNFPAPAVLDNCPGVTTNCVPPSGSTFPLGTTTVTCTATDVAGNTATCSFTVSTFNICLQDESNPSTVLLWNSLTGEYRFCCGGTLFTGFGQASSKGNVFTLQVYGPGRRIVARVDESVHRGTASLQVLGTGLFCSITDFNTLNNSCQCQ